MRSHLVVVLFSSLGLFACGGANQKAKNEPNLWGNFTGKYSEPAKPRAKAESDEPAKKEAEPKTEDEAAPTAAAAAPAVPKKTSQATVKGESISSISAEALAEASKTALNSAAVSNSVLVGPQYELVQVELKTATVQIIRPAGKPAPNGLPIPSPKAKHAELEPNDAGWYDEEADVLVIVNAAKKAAAQKALGEIVTRP